MGFKLKKIIKKIAPVAAIAATGVVGGVAGAAIYQKVAPMAQAYMQNRRATSRAAEAEQAQLFPSVASPGQLPQLAPGAAYPAYPAGGGFWSFLAKLFGMG